MTVEAASLSLNEMCLAAQDEEPTAQGDAATQQLVAFVEAARAGDVQAFEQLMLSTERDTARIVWRLLIDKQDVADAMQEVYLRAYKYLARFHTDRNFAAWLSGIAVNVCHDFNRRRKTFESMTDEDTTDELNALRAPDGIEDRYASAQQRRIVEEALTSLTPKERAAVVLRDLEGLTTEETARRLGTSPATVRSQLSAARRKLKIHCARLLQTRTTRAK